MIAIIDYNMGNSRSVANAFEAAGFPVQITRKTEDLEKATHIVLPGVGAFGEGMKNLKELGLIPVLNQQVLEKKKPFLGICLGMQILAQKSFEFGEHEGLGWIPGTVERLKVSDLPLPHVGWNSLQIRTSNRVLDRIQTGADFYFVHSYYFKTEKPEHASAACSYGQDFTAVVNRDHIFGVQFHPEKSQKAGKALIENFGRIS